MLAAIFDLENVIPSHDPYNDVFVAPNLTEFEKCLVHWMTALQEFTAGQVVAIDGKSLHGSFDKASGKSAIPMVGA